MSVISTRCKEVFFRKHLRDHFQCSRSAVKDGYCKQHHPESRKALAIKNEARYNANILKRASTTDVRLAELEKANDALEAENAALKAELAEAKKDAERYRWLRARDCVYPAPRYHDDVASCEQIDWSIDKSMAKETKP